MDDTLAAIDEISIYARERRPDAILFGGDLYHTSGPGQIVQREAARRLLELAKIAPVVGVAGNHDQTAQASATDVIDIAAGEVRIANQPTTVKVGDIYIVCIPWLREKQILALDPRKSVKEAKHDLGKVIEVLLDLALSKIPQNAPKVLLAHCTTLNAQYGAHKPTVLGRDLIWPSSWFDPFDYVSLGHIHKAQIINEDPVALYPGSPERVDFGEKDEPKGFYIFDGEPEFIELDSRPMIYVDGVPKEVEQQIIAAPDGAIIKGKVHLEKGQTWYGIESSRFYSFNVAREYPREERIPRYGTATDLGKLSTEELLVLFFESTSVPIERQERLLAAFQELKDAEG